MNDHQRRFRTFFQEKLNAEQQKAVAPKSGIFLVTAAAGSGKTRVITARIMQLLLEHEVDPRAIIALTFTNKAAREMRDRVMAALPPQTPAPLLGTFHSYCLHTLKQHGHLINRATFSILDTHDKETLLKQIIKRCGSARGITPGSISTLISRHKNEITRRTVAHLPPLTHEARACQAIFAAYEQEKEAARCLDFDDLLLETLRLFQTTSYKHHFQSTVQHLLVDEYQDTNRVQHALIREMMQRVDRSSALESICIVGDEDQSIYSWRGATIDNLLTFSAEFPMTQSVTISQNYRSVHTILEVANAVIHHNRMRNPKQLWSTRQGENRVKLITCATAFHEAELIAQCLRALMPHKRLAHAAILYRSHFQSRVLEEALIRNSVPYKIIGGTQFYDRQEVKDLLAYMRIAVNPHDRVAFGRTINTPARGLGEVFVTQWDELWMEYPDATIFELAERFMTTLPLRPAQKNALTSYLACITAIAAQPTASTALEEAIIRTKFMEHLQNQYEPTEARDRSANVTELVNALSALAQRGITSAEAFLQEVALVQEHMQADAVDKDYVQLMTIHSAKGLEFDLVIIPGLEEGMLPSQQAMFDAAAVEEERRLMYVAITRARERLLMTRSLSRFIYGTVHDQTPSRFIAEMPSRFVHAEDYSSWHTRAESSATVWFSQRIGEDRITEPTTYHAAHRTTSKPPSSAQMFSVHQQVSHPTFGTGTIVQINTTSNGKTYVTVQFATEVKKVAASFVQPC